MGRPLSLTDNQTHPVQWVQNAQYNVANQLLSASYSPGYTETRHYNTLLQMDEQMFTTPGSGSNPNMDLHYSFSPNHNNGKILGVTESVTGETINYGYDTLNRLISASGAGNPGLGAWGQTLTFDGFGNLTEKTATGNATSLHVTVDPATNRLQSGNQYDPQTGNLTGTGNLTMTYDVDNRVSTVAVSSAPADMYGYDQTNQRVWTLTPAGGEQVHFFGAFGERLATYKPVSQGSASLTQVTTDLYFAGRRIVSNGQVIMTDRLGSMRYGSNQATNFWFYPYGEEPATTAQDRDKFATYFRDSTTGIDYAQNRYYSSILGRFLTADPYRASGGPADPGSWNRYAYTRGDPVNRMDPRGLKDCFADGCDPFPDCDPEIGNCDGSGNPVGPSSGGDRGGGVGGGCFVLNGGQFASGGLPPGQVCPPPPPPPPPSPQCTVTLEGKPVPLTLHQFFHTFLAVNLGDGSPTDYLEGVPIPKNPKHRSPISDAMWLNGSDRITGPYYSSIGVDLTSAIKTTQNSCRALIQLTDNYIAERNGTITYNNTLTVFAGPNSNSFTHSLLVAAGISTPWWWVSLYAIAPGWGNTSVPF